MDGPQGMVLLLLLVAIMVPLERLWPVRQQPILRRELTTDLLHLVLTSIISRLLSTLMIALTVVALVWGVSLVTSVAAVRAQVAAQPFLLQFAEAMLLLELLAYWTHRCSHEWPWWWRLHAVHHSTRTMDWLATPRLHWLDQALRRSLKLAPLALLGFSKETFALVVLITPLMTFLIHANVRLSWWGPLRFVYTSPHFHHWHHALEPMNRNYSDQFPWLDWLFGTLYLPRGQWPTQYGIRAPMPSGWWAQMWHPFRARQFNASPIRNDGAG